MTRLEEFTTKAWGEMPAGDDVGVWDPSKEYGEPMIVKTTRLEEIEAWLKKIDRWNKGHVPTGGVPTTYHVQEADLLYALDCYKARVAVLEEALKKLAPFVAESAFEVDSKLALTPEQCLERMKEVG